MASKIVEETIAAYLEANWTATSIFTENQENETPSRRLAVHHPAIPGGLDHAADHLVAAVPRGGRVPHRHQSRPWCRRD